MVIFYDTKKFFETGDYNHALVGNVPIIVNRNTGAVTLARSNQTVDEIIQEYERALKS